MEDNLLMALDVGTRKVTGVLIEQAQEGYIIKAIATKEHEKRAMVDGQIHDIPEVAKVISHIRHQLEEKGDCKIQKASVAAAGRSLCTMRAKSEMSIKPSVPVTQNDITGMEYAAVHSAQKQLIAKSQGKIRFTDQYCCVGYSVSRYTLDGSDMTNLCGQRGTSASCEVIATFLPRVVVDSLRSVLEMAELKLHSMTLEPIAALRMVVPEGMRKLNLALVDVGAGTSDIAITRDGAVSAYDMVQVAGDEITEALCQHFLLDFMSAEDLKRKLHDQGDIHFSNILDEKMVLRASEICAAVSPVLEGLAEQIAQSILKHNEEAPQAVFCVGGGSLMPGFTSHLASKLEMEPGRVVIKGKDMIALLPSDAGRFSGPDLVTPLGIASTAYHQEALRFYSVSVNNKATDVLDLGGGTVADVLLAAAISSKDLVGTPGRGLTVDVNNQLMTFPGTMGEMAQIMVNEKPAMLDTKVERGDKISFAPATLGSDASVDVGMLLSRIEPFRLLFNGEACVFNPPVYREGKILSPTTIITDNDKLHVLRKMPLSMVRERLGLENHRSSSICVTVNSKDRQIPVGTDIILINNKPAVDSDEVSSGDVLEFSKEVHYPTIASITDAKEKKIDFWVNEVTTSFWLKKVTLKVNGQKSSREQLLKDGDNVTIEIMEQQLTLAEFLHQINFQSVVPAGKSHPILRINGLEAELTAVIKDGDRLEIGWAS